MVNYLHVSKLKSNNLWKRRQSPQLKVVNEHNVLIVHKPCRLNLNMLPREILITHLANILKEASNIHT